LASRSGLARLTCPSCELACLQDRQGRPQVEYTAEHAAHHTLASCITRMIHKAFNVRCIVLRHSLFIYLVVTVAEVCTVSKLRQMLRTCRLKATKIQTLVDLIVSRLVVLLERGGDDGRAPVLHPMVGLAKNTTLDTFPYIHQQRPSQGLSNCRCSLPGSRSVGGWVSKVVLHASRGFHLITPVTLPWGSLALCNTRRLLIIQA
jgi:hypothetical protein